MKKAITLILKELSKRNAVKMSDLRDRIGISRQAIHRHLAALVKSGEVLKLGSSRKTTFYVLNNAEAKRRVLKKPRRFGKRVLSRGLEEDTLLKEVEAQPGLLEGLSEDAKANFGYAFTEMVNNAIDHSGAKYIQVNVAIDRGMSVFSVADSGIGVFENIRKKLGLSDELDAIRDLLKGKQTTMPERHSGEGIFFTSKIADRFVLESHSKRLVVDNLLEDVFIEDIRIRKGTRVVFEQRVDSRRQLVELFRRYTDERFQFRKSQVTVKLFTGKEAYISRSQAKRLLHALEHFEEIVLDFKDVPTVGQAFADEVFRVFGKAHPETKIVPINCNENVDFMIRRALSGAIEA